MLIRTGFDIRFKAVRPVPTLALLSVHPEREKDLRTPQLLTADPDVPLRPYSDHFGNICTRLTVPEGGVRLSSDFVIEDSGMPDAQNPGARQLPVEDLPDETLIFLLGSRYCETDRLQDEAWRRFADIEPGWARVAAIVDAAHERIEFDYGHARADRTAWEAYCEGRGVCRDFAHLAITLCRCMNIPARYCTGYLGDIGIDPIDAPMDFSAWFEAYLEGGWYAFDARHNCPRIGRIVMARGRDATDTAITTTFGSAELVHFDVHTDEVASTDLTRAPETTALPQSAAA